MSTYEKEIDCSKFSPVQASADVGCSHASEKYDKVGDSPLERTQEQANARL